MEINDQGMVDNTATSASTVTETQENTGASRGRRYRRPARTTPRNKATEDTTIEATNTPAVTNEVAATEQPAARTPRHRRTNTPRNRATAPIDEDVLTPAISITTEPLPPMNAVEITSIKPTVVPPPFLTIETVEELPTSFHPTENNTSTTETAASISVNAVDQTVSQQTEDQRSPRRYRFDRRPPQNPIVQTPPPAPTVAPNNGATSVPASRRLGPLSTIWSRPTLTPAQAPAPVEMIEPEPYIAEESTFAEDIAPYVADFNEDELEDIAIEAEEILAETIADSEIDEDEVDTSTIYAIEENDQSNAYAVGSKEETANSNANRRHRRRRGRNNSNGNGQDDVTPERDRITTLPPLPLNIPTVVPAPRYQPEPPLYDYPIVAQQPTTPYSSPEPAPARGFGAPQRGVAAEFRTPVPHMSRTARIERNNVDMNGTGNVSNSSMAAIMLEAIQQQTDRLLAEQRRTTSAPMFTVSLPSTERVGIFVDVANLLYSSRSMRIPIDFGKLLQFLRSDRRLIRAHAYCPTSPEPYADQQFLQAVKGLGYRITTKDYKTFSSGAKKADLDLDLCMDIVRIVDAGAVDTIVLVSGDSDFLPLLAYCSDHGVRCEVAAFDESTATILRQSCDLFMNLSLVEDIRA